MRGSCWKAAGNTIQGFLPHRRKFSPASSALKRTHTPLPPSRAHGLGHRRVAIYLTSGEMRLPSSSSRHSRAAEPDSRAAQRNDRRATDSVERERLSCASTIPVSHWPCEQSQSPSNCARTVSALRSGDSSVNNAVPRHEPAVAATIPRAASTRGNTSNRKPDAARIPPPANPPPDRSTPSPASFPPPPGRSHATRRFARRVMRRRIQGHRLDWIQPPP